VSARDEGGIVKTNLLCCMSPSKAFLSHSSMHITIFPLPEHFRRRLLLLVLHLSWWCRCAVTYVSSYSSLLELHCISFFREELRVCSPQFCFPPPFYWREIQKFIQLRSFCKRRPDSTIYDSESTSISISSSTPDHCEHRLTSRIIQVSFASRSPL
jgi:hypothetical protein